MLIFGSISFAFLCSLSLGIPSAICVFTSDSLSHLLTVLFSYFTILKR